jgi:hypothetical protein
MRWYFPMVELILTIASSKIIGGTAIKLSYETTLHFKI